MAKSRKELEAENLLGIQDRIADIQSKTNKLAQENADIMKEAGLSMQSQLEAEMRSKAEAAERLSFMQGMSKVDALRAMTAQAIADGTLETFGIEDKILQIKKETKYLSQEERKFLNESLKDLKSKTAEMQKQDIFGKSEADRLKENNDKAKENTKTMRDILGTTAQTVEALTSMKSLFSAALLFLADTAKESFKLQRSLGTNNALLDTFTIGATTISARVRAIGRGFALTGDEAREVITAVTMLNGSLKDATAATVTTVGEMTVKFGLSAEEAAKLNKNMQMVTGEGQAGADAMLQQVKNLAKAHQVAPGAVMKDIAANSVEFARFGKDGASGLVNAAANAKKLGLNLEKVVAAGDSLLDVQGSIQKEMKAEMLIGRQLNLDAARQAALAGDRDTLVREIAANAGTLAEFENMNVVQQRALAEAMGVQVGDVVKVLQAKQKGVNLDSKVLEAQSAQRDAVEDTAAATAMVASSAAGIGSQLLSALPALATVKMGFGDMIPKGLGARFKNLFGGAAKESVKVGDQLSKVKTPKDGGKGMTGFFKSLSKIKTSSMIKAALAIAIVAVSLIPAAYAFSLLEGVDPVTILAFGATMIGLALALSVIAGVGGPMIAGALAFGIASIALIPAAFAMNQLTADPASMLAFAGAVAILGVGIAAMGALAIPIALGTAVLFGLSKVLPAATAGFANLSGVDGGTLSAFALAILPLGLGLAAFGLMSPAILLGLGALSLSAAVLPAVTAGLAGLSGIDGGSLLGFSLSILPLAAGLAAFGLASPAIVLGVGALALAAAVLPSVTSGLQNISGVDPASMMGFAKMLVPLAAGLAAFGLIAPLAIIGAAALAVVGAGVVLFAKSFSLMAGVDASAIDNLGSGIKSMIAIVDDLGVFQAGKLIAKAAAIAALGVAIMPFGLAVKAAGAGDPEGLVNALRGLTEIGAAPLAAAGVGMGLLGLGFMAFLPVTAFMPIMAESLAIISPALAILAPLGEGLLLAGQGVFAFGMGMIPLAIGLMLAAPFIPLMPLLAESFVTLTPPLMQLSEIADVLPVMGMGFMMLGIGLQPFVTAMAMLFPFQTVLPILAQAIIDMAPPLQVLAPLGPQIMYLATAIGALGIASALATYPLFAFGTASYYAAPAVYLLGEASKVLGAGLQAVKVPLLEMAQQFPMILGLSAAITTLGASLLFATPSVFMFGAAALFASLPVIALAAGLSLMVATADGLTSVGTGLSSIAAGLAEVSQYKGTIAMLAIAAPALALLGGTGLLGGIGGGGGNNEGGGSNEALIAKMDELIAVINAKDYEPVLQIDGRKVGTAVARKRAPKGMGT